jgi:serine/threonine-protein kinase
MFPQESAGGASAAVAQPISAPVPKPVGQVAVDLLQQVARAPVSMLNWASELSYGRQISLIALAAALVIAAVVTITLLAQRKSASAVAPDPGKGAPPKSNTAPTPPPGMVYIPGGKFTMGYNGSDQEAEKPEHEATVAPFFLDKYEVTIEDYYKFIKSTNRAAPKNWPATWKQGQFRPEEAKLPMTDVTWFDARDYARSVGKRLPTEEEWEYAARGADKRLYPWGFDFNPNRANVGDPERTALKPVGSFPADKSPFEVFDMAGNVFEWVGSDWSLYPNSKAPPTKPGKMVRGGSYSKDKVFAMVTVRSILRTDAHQEDVGFRCAKDAPNQ